MATDYIDTSLPRAPDDSDVEMFDPAESNRGKEDFQDAVPKEIQQRVSDTIQIATAASSSQKSSSESSSFIYQSETSTLAHEQTPFVDFKLQVVELCHLIWPPAPRRPLSKQSPRPSGNRFAGLLKSRKLGQSKTSSLGVPDATYEHPKKKSIVE